MYNNLKVYGSVDDNSVQQMLRACAEAANRIMGAVITADGHLGYGFPIGGVMALRGAVSPTGVGYDVCCGNGVYILPTRWDSIKDKAKLIGDVIWRSVEFGVGQGDSKASNHPLFNDPSWESNSLMNQPDLIEKARHQLGSVGSGNHYVNVMEVVGGAFAGHVAIANHFGSRGFGHTVATNTFKRLGAKDSINADAVFIEEGMALYEEYMDAMRLAGLYAMAGRQIVLETVRKIIAPHEAPIVEVHNHHNYAWVETHFGEKVVVVRKGATPLFPGQYSFIGSSMAEESVIVCGEDTEEAKRAFYSTVHGAGRVMSRRAAHKEIDVAEWQAQLRNAGVLLYGAGKDEAPNVYKRLPEVLAHHPYTRVVSRLAPRLVFMAGEDVFDPYKD